MNERPGKRIIIVGSTGVGKSTLAKELSALLSIEHIELDSLYWYPDWTHREYDEFCSMVEQRIKVDQWVADGNYHVSREMLWKAADTVIWLDYPLGTIFWQLWNRTWRRWWQKELLWGTNRERIYPHLKFWSVKDSLFAWLFSTYHRRRDEYAALITDVEYDHLKIIHLRTPREKQTWLQNIQ